VNCKVSARGQLQPRQNTVENVYKLRGRIKVLHVTFQIHVLQHVFNPKQFIHLFGSLTMWLYLQSRNKDDFTAKRDNSIHASRKKIAFCFQKELSKLQ